jgi:hypothetical protein
MNRFILSLCLLFAFSGIIVLPSISLAQTPGSAPEEQASPGVGGEQKCDLDALKKSLNQTESSGKGCDFKGTGKSKKWGLARGKYQFIEATWNRMAKGCPNANQCPHSQIAYKAECCATQECAMNNLLLSNKAGIEKKATCKAIMGKTIKSPKYGSCTVTLSGLMAAWHLGGADACDGPASGGYGDSDGHTTEADYICKHGGIPVNGDCQPTSGPSDPNQAPPVGTIQQIETQTAQGEEVIVGSANGILENWVAGLMLMAEQFTSNMIHQMKMLGTIFDAKHQLETQRLFQQKMAEAHKDYHPSEQMCTFGTFSRDLAATDRSSNLTRNALSTELLQRDTASGDSKGTSDVADSITRIAAFRKYFCNPGDNANGLALLCPSPPPQATRNKDINYTMTIDQPLSLDVNLINTEVTDDERAIFALIDNLFLHDPMPPLPSGALDLPKYQYHYMNVRSIIAMRGIARNSIANIIAIKTATPNTETQGGSSAPYLRALFREFGIQDQEIRDMLGPNPSYYAQMELLTKKIYQNPMFYTALYDKPTNVKRIRAAMTAIKLMQDRDIASSLQRREMLLSMMLELRLRQQAEEVYSATEKALFDQQ